MYTIILSVCRFYPPLSFISFSSLLFSLLSFLLFLSLAGIIPRSGSIYNLFLNVHVHADNFQFSILVSSLSPSPPSLPPLPSFSLSLSLSLQVESKQLVHGRIFDIASQRGRGGTYMYLRLLVNFNENTISLYKEVGGKTCIFSCIFNDVH